MSQPNILFILIDALRADRCFGKNKTAKTPNLDSLIKNGINFKNAFSASDGTPISFSSIFTGMYPFKATERKGRWNFQMKKGIVNYITILKKNGYTTLTTMPKMHVVDQFISLFDNDDKTYPLFGYRLYDGLGEDIVKKLKTNLSEPWFHFIHLMDAHKPISYPQKFENEKYGKDEYDRMLYAIDEWLGKFVAEIDLKNTIIVITADHGDYLRVVDDNGKRFSFEYNSYASSALTISKITPKILYPIKNKLFLKLRDIITKRKISKIGRPLTPYEKRSLFNARSDSERYLYDELFHVPLIFSGYNLPKEKSIEHQVESVDIFPTICDICNIKDHENKDGISLIPLINGNKMKEKTVYMESGFNLDDPEKAVIGIRTPSYKYFRKIVDSKENGNLYDLNNDPKEELNIAEKNPDIVNRMESILMEIRNLKVKTQVNQNENTQSYENNSEMSKDEQKEVEEQLKKLGYL